MTPGRVRGGPAGEGQRLGFGLRTNRAGFACAKTPIGPKAKPQSGSAPRLSSAFTLSTWPLRAAATARFQAKWPCAWRFVMEEDGWGKNILRAGMFQRAKRSKHAQRADGQAIVRLRSRLQQGLHRIRLTCAI